MVIDISYIVGLNCYQKVDTLTELMWKPEMYIDIRRWNQQEWSTICASFARYSTPSFTTSRVKDHGVDWTPTHFRVLCCVRNEAFHHTRKVDERADGWSQRKGRHHQQNNQTGWKKEKKKDDGLKADEEEKKRRRRSEKTSIKGLIGSNMRQEWESVERE